MCKTVSIDRVTGLLTGWDAVAGPLNSPFGTPVSLPGWDAFDIDLVTPSVQTHSLVFNCDFMAGGPFINCTICNGGLGALASTQDLSFATMQTADNGQLRGGVVITYNQRRLHHPLAAGASVRHLGFACAGPGLARCTMAHKRPTMPVS